MKSLTIPILISVFSICMIMLSCDGNKTKGNDDVSYVGPGTSGIPNDERPDTSQIDVGILVNEDGTYLVQGTIPSDCPLVYGINSRSYLKTDVCDPQFDYSKLVDQAIATGIAVARKMDCPHHCPYKEGYPEPAADHYLRWECVPQQDGSFLYFVTCTGFFVCKDKQI
jgi:hypothetical protein